MSKFESSKFKISDEKSPQSKANIIKSDPASQPVVKNFDLQPVRKMGEEEYSSVKSKFGPLAVTDAERASRLQRDRRFSLNPLLRDPLSVEQEELRTIDEKVQIQVKALAESVKAAAIEKGFQAGLKLGHEEAFKKFGEESADLLHRLESVIHEVENAKHEMFHANERFLIEMVYRIAKSVLLKELSTDRNYVLRLAKELVAKVGIRDYVRLRLNPADTNLIGDLKEGLQKSFGAMENLTIEVSEEVNPGSCSVQTEWNAIDANLDKQLNGIYEALIGEKSGDSA